MTNLGRRLRSSVSAGTLADTAPHLAWAVVSVLPVVWEPHCYTFVISAALIAAWPFEPAKGPESG